MVISRELDYAMRILRCISDGETHPVGKVCDSERIPRKFGQQILEKLQNANILICIRGRNGGCKLTIDLKEITIFDLMEALGIECCVNLCLVPKSVCAWQETHKDVYEVHKTLATLQEEINDRLKQMDMDSIICE